ncbi:hypothetical protein [Amycolatopsis sp. SID8362]|uniref:hypothetical protein n=1 Tax=Amycolatopsis sp. SID8362 TaxID=2690346 RepID=UPI00136F9A68|nr:hypothetical protein [Amycolatopsis sp. SID8362]NBH07471.1 hypothetical protein [Amycolatopsis sp. SID8362]NED44167.1 hypothetical protein [Amycolatopsis sp. SID8362]
MFTPAERLVHADCSTVTGSVHGWTVPPSLVEAFESSDRQMQATQGPGGRRRGIVSSGNLRTAMAPRWWPLAPL